MEHRSEAKQEEERLGLGPAWFVLSTHWRQEKLALENLQRQGFDAYLPMHQVEVRPKGQPVRVQALPLFPRYLFVAVDLGQAGWRKIYSTRGVGGVLPSTRAGSVALARLVGELQDKEERGFIRLVPSALPCRWNPGDRVRLNDLIDAVFEERVDDRRCRILVSMLGTDSSQVVDLAQLS